MPDDFENSPPTSNEKVLNLLNNYEQNFGSLRLSRDDFTYMMGILTGMYDFSCTIGMESQFTENFPKCIFFIHSGNFLGEWLNPRGRLSKDMRQAITLLVLLGLIQANTPTTEEVEHLESVVEPYLKTRDKNWATSLLLLTQVLNEYTFKNNKENFIEFKKEYFDLDEVLIPESALMAALSTFRLASSLAETHPAVKDNLKNVFKLFYIYYSDVHNLLPYQSLLSLNQEFLKRYVHEARHTRFYFEFMIRLFDGINKSEILKEGSFYRDQKIHPFLLFDDLPKVSYDFYEKVQKNTQDFITNFDKYAKDYKDVLCYVWLEIEHSYQLAKSLNDDDVKVEDAKILATDILGYVEDLYFEYKFIPNKSLVGFLTGGNKLADGQFGFTATDQMMDNLMQKSFEYAGKASVLQNTGLLDYLKNESVQNFIKTGVKNMNLGKNVQSTMVKKYVSTGFPSISNGVRMFWQGFSKTSEIKNMAQQGDNEGIFDSIVGVVKKPVMSMTSKGLEKIPYGDMINTQNLHGILDTAIRHTRLTFMKNILSTGPTFTSGSQMMTDFAKSLDEKKGAEEPQPAPPSDWEKIDLDGIINSVTNNNKDKT